MTQQKPGTRKRKSLARRRPHFERLNETQFEDFTVALLRALKFVNVDWRKGTGKSSSPADRGRDIECHLMREDVDGSVNLERWFVECKHFKRGVPAAELHNLLAWAQAERPDVVLLVASNFLSNAAKDHLTSYKQNQRPPFKIRVWERPDLEKLTASRYGLLREHHLVDPEPFIRRAQEVLDAEEELQFKFSYHISKASIDLMRLTNSRMLPGSETIYARKKEKLLIKRYGKGALRPRSELELAVLRGKLAALRWVLGWWPEQQRTLDEM